MKSFTVTVVEDENGELVLPFPDGFMDELGWEIGDTLNWKDNKDGSFTIEKKVGNTPSDEKGNDQGHGALTS